jgi:hypothetical protein
MTSKWKYEIGEVRLIKLQIDSLNEITSSMMSFFMLWSSRIEVSTQIEVDQDTVG